MPGISIKTILPDPKASDKTKDNIYNYNFFVKDYQRGYRWEEKQITDLLQDIYDFDDNNKKLKYCLQPLVVKPIDSFNSSHSLENIIRPEKNVAVEHSNSWELIDGQQRLTTIWLILHCCDSDFIPYSIFYEYVRQIDNYYLTNAKEIIENWFSSYGPLEKDIKYDIRSKINRSIQFIWYQVEKENNSVDIFTKINMGKIPLTNAELFKALLLNTDNIPFEKSTEQIGEYERAKNQLEKIAFEWDYIEQSLRDDEFWYFISNDYKEAETRIDYLLKLKAKQLKASNAINEVIYETDSLFSFLVINSFLKSNCSDDLKIYFENNIELWKDIVQLHDTLKTWSTDREIYHYVGFLVTPHARGEKYIEELIIKSTGKKQSEIKDLVLQDIKNLFKGVQLEELSYNNSGDSKKIRNALLFFNIYTMIQSRTDSKFSFKNYKDKNISWDVEHIHARATDHEVQQLREVDKMKELLHSVKNQFVELNLEDDVKKIDDYVENNLTEKFNNYEGFFEFYRDMIARCGDFDENSIGNLALLDSETNRSYHNALFPIKRKKIIERDMGEVFVPVCTKNVFLKMYSKKTDDMMRWTNQDADDYLTAMKKALVEDAKICL